MSATDRPLHLQGRALVAVFVGGVAGVALRDALSTAFPPDPGGFPLTTFLINVAGAFLLGLLLTALALAGDGDRGRRRWARLAGGTGFLGGFTTYSTFVVESVTRAGGGALGLAFLYDAASLLAGFAAAYAAVMLAARLVPTRGAR